MKRCFWEELSIEISPSHLFQLARMINGPLEGQNKEQQSSKTLTGKQIWNILECQGQLHCKVTITKWPRSNGQECYFRATAPKQQNGEKYIEIISEV